MEASRAGAGVADAEVDWNLAVAQDLLELGVLFGLAPVDEVAGGDDGGRSWPQDVDGAQHLPQAQFIATSVKGVLVRRDVQVRDLRDC